jgi:CheY-like chemotaxis protein
VTSILIVDDDEQLRSAVARDLGHRGFQVTAVDSVKDALVRLRARAFDVLLTDLRMGEQDGIDLLAQLPDVAPKMPAILMSAFASARDHQRAIELGAVQVLCKPFTSLDLAMAIRQAIECETGFRGNLHGISLVDVLQMFHLSRRSVCVTVGGRPGGVVHVRDGEIVHAAQGDVVGEDALRSILGLDSGSIRSGPLETNEQSIRRPFEALLLDMLRGVDEERRENALDFDEAFAVVRALSLPPRATGLAELCSELVGRVEGGLRCGAVDLEHRSLLGFHVAPGDREGAERALLEDAVALLSGTTMKPVEDLIAQELGKPARPSAYHEARVLFAESCRLMLTTHAGRRAVVLDTRRDTSPGLALWHLRSCLPAFEREL